MRTELISAAFSLFTSARVLMPLSATRTCLSSTIRRGARWWPRSTLKVREVAVVDAQEAVAAVGKADDASGRGGGSPCRGLR